MTKKRLYAGIWGMKRREKVNKKEKV